MPGRLADSVFLARTLVGAGVARPSRPDRVARALAGLHRWGPTLAAGYLGAAARYPSAEAVCDERGSLSFEAVHNRSNALAHGLAERGVREGGGVAIMCRNHRGFIEASVACSKLGAHVLYLNTSFAGPQVSEVVHRETPLAIVYDHEFGQVTEQAREGRPAFVAWSDDAAAVAPSLEDLIAVSEDSTPSPPSVPGRTVILTSGTTGPPKGANRASPSSLAPRFEGYTGGADKVRLGCLMATGDLGHFDRDGRLFVDGRDDDMIVSGGENVFPGEVEEVLAAVAGVREAAVIGVPDEQFGERLRAFVTLAEGASLIEQQLKDTVRARLASFKVPRKVHFVAALPGNATGKILKRELAQR